MALKSAGIREDAVRDIVRSYDTERRSTAQGVIDVAAALVRDTVKEAKTYVATIERNAGYITGMGVAYDQCESPMVKASEAGIWKAGFRCPDVPLTSVIDNTKETWLYKEVSYGKYLVLSIGMPALEETNENVTNITVQRSSSEAAAFTGDWVQDDDCALVVVRPDMYIGYVAKDADECRAYLSTLFA